MDERNLLYHRKRTPGNHPEKVGRRILATSQGEDHACKLWDLRQRRCIYTLPAHSSLISTACFETGRGDALLTGSYDGTLRVWSTASYACLNTLEAHEGKVAAGALAMGAGFVVSAGFDKTLKRWRVDQEEDLV
eukprot:jgi/Pico_ML_1/51333/g2387.t1